MAGSDASREQLFLQRLAALYFQKTSSRNLQLDSLDGVRGFAVALVLLSHLELHQLPVVRSVNLVGLGKGGVFLFFTLSSFLLTLPFLRCASSDFGNVKVWWTYLSRRVLRIFPLFTLVLVLGYVFAGDGIFVSMRRGELWQHLTLQQGRDVFWAIPVEFKYYLAIPIVALAFRFVFGNRLLWSLIGTGFVVAMSIWLWPKDEVAFNAIILGPYLPIFLLGSFSALVYFRITEGTMGSQPRIRAGFEILAIALFFASWFLNPGTLNFFFGWNLPHWYFFESFLLFGAFWAVFLVACLSGSGLTRRLLSTRPIRFLGIISFSVYLWHSPIFNVVNEIGIRSGAGVCAAVIATLLVSSISFVLIERPFIRLGLRMSRS